MQQPVIWITGASSGIGKALARQYAAKAKALVLSARSEDKLLSLAQSLPVDCLVLVMDMSRTDSFAQAVETVINKFGRIDILINNAGISQRSWAADTQLSVDRKIMDVNFFGPVALSKLVLPYMQKQGYGSIAVTSSVVGKLQTPRRTAYAASKHAIQGWFDCLRAEVHKDNIQINLILPGYVKTDLSFAALEADGRAHGKMNKTQERGMSADLCAKKIVSAIEKNQAETVIAGYQERTGLLLKRFFPALYRWVAQRIPVE